MKQEVKHKCQYCDHEITFNAYPVINLQSDHFLYHELFSLELFKIKCPKCNKITLVTYDLIVIDMYKKYMVYLCSSKMLGEFFNEIDSTISKLCADNEFKKAFDDVKYLRVVTNLNELLDKLLIYDYDLNDKVIELIKYGLHKYDKIDKSKYLNICFDKLERDTLAFTCFGRADSGVQPISITIDFKYYNSVIDTLNGLPEEEKKFQYIDKVWAKLQTND